MFDALDEQQLIYVWEALHDARELARDHRQMMKAGRYDRMILAIYGAPNWNDRKAFGQ